MGRRARLAAAVVVVVVATSAAPASVAAQTAPAHEAEGGDNCDIGPIGVPSAVCDVGSSLGGVLRGVDDVADPVGTVAGAVSDAAGAVGESAMEGFVRWVADGSVWLITEIADVVLDTSRIALEAPWVETNFSRMRDVAATLMLLFVFAAVVRGLRQGDIGEIAKAVAVRLPVAALATGAAIALVALALDVTDAMSAYVASNVRADLDAFVTGATTTLSASSGAGPADAAARVLVPSVLVLLGAALVLLGGLVVWIELLLRSAAVYIAVAFLPLVFAASIWPAAGKWAKRLVEFLAAVILAKFVIVATFALAAAMLGSRTGEGFPGLLGAGTVMLLAALSPAAVFTIVQFAEAAASPSRQTVGSPGRAMYTAYTGHQIVSRAMHKTSSTASRGPVAMAGAAAGAAVGAGPGTQSLRGGAGVGPGRGAPSRSAAGKVGAPAGRLPASAGAPTPRTPPSGPAPARPTPPRTPPSTPGSSRHG